MIEMLSVWLSLLKKHLGGFKDEKEQEKIWEVAVYIYNFADLNQ